MKTSIGKRILIVILLPFFIIFLTLLIVISVSVSQYVTDWTQLELKGISEINAADLAGRIYSVRASVLSAADMLDTIDSRDMDSRVTAENILKSMLKNHYIYNSWLAYEPDAFDGRDAQHTTDYPGAPSGRFIRSYVMLEGEIVTAPDMDESTLDDPLQSPWYVLPRDSNELYLDLDNDIPNLYDYGLDSDPVYTLSIVMPLHKDGHVIGCVGADVLFDVTTFYIDSEKQAAVAVFYPNGRVFYSPNLKFAEDSIDTLGFNDANLIKETISEGGALFLPNEYSRFLDTHAFTYFQPVVSDGSEESSLYLYAAMPRDSVFFGINSVFYLIYAVGAATLILVAAMIIYVNLKISKPLKTLSLAADAISQGDLETEIVIKYDDGDEIGVLTRSLQWMVEQFRVYIIQLKNTQEEIMISSQLNIILDPDDTSKSLDELPEFLCRHFNLGKVSMVYLKNSGAKLCAVFDSDHEKDASENKTDFLYHNDIETIISGKKLVYMNSYTISQTRARFLSKDTYAACIVPIWKESELLGYIILESFRKNKIISVNAENILIDTAKALSACWEEEAELSEPSAPLAEEGAAESSGEEEPEDAAKGTIESTAALLAIRHILGQDADKAISAMGGIVDIYEQSVRLLTRLLPETKERLERFLDEDINAFAIEIHGLKGSLNNIGAYTLGDGALKLERAAKDGDIELCREEFPLFREQLMDMHTKLSAVLDSGGEKMPGDKAALNAALLKAGKAASEYDVTDALEILNPFRNCAFDSETEDLISEIINALEIFDCEAALELIEKLNETGSVDYTEMRSK